MTDTPEQPTFAARMGDFCSLLGRDKVAKELEISDRTLRYWLAGTIIPLKPTRAGAIMLLECHVETTATVSTPFVGIDPASPSGDKSFRATIDPETGKISFEKLS